MSISDESIRNQASILKAINQEIAASSQSEKDVWLEIDGIQLLHNVTGRLGYRILLSTSLPLSPEQILTFKCRNPPARIQAEVVSSDDEGITIVCDKPLPLDAKMINASFDPIFILLALKTYLEESSWRSESIGFQIINQMVLSASDIPVHSHDGLNQYQARAVDMMSANSLYLLWGPPGTGKTTTLGTAIVGWMREKKRVLVVSTSNAAVDMTMRAVLRSANSDEKIYLQRLGTSLDPEVAEITPDGQLILEDPRLAGAVREIQNQVQQLQKQFSRSDLSPNQWHTLFEDQRKIEVVMKEFSNRSAQLAKEHESDVLVTGCTLAKMVLDKDLRNILFDVVVVDEASMVSMVYALAAARMAGNHIVYGGDPRQLPPIVQGRELEAALWFGHNVYDWFSTNVLRDSIPQQINEMLRIQYRMTNQIGDVVSRLSYDDFLIHGRNIEGPPIEFIEVPDEWQETYYSAEEKSYYHPAAIPIIQSTIKRIKPDELLLLTPFRSQRRMLASLAFDLSLYHPKMKVSASTIHQSQGSECSVVVVDLTTYSPQKLVAFFRDRKSANLFNVAISRAKDRLFIIGSKATLVALSSEMLFWQRVVREFDDGIRTLNWMDSVDMLAEQGHLNILDSMNSLSDDKVSQSGPAIYSHSIKAGSWHHIAGVLTGFNSSRKLLVLPRGYDNIPEGDFIVRESDDCPPLFVGAGHICIPLHGRWIAVDAPSVARVIWQIGFSNLADEEVDPVQAKRFFCPKCPNGNLILKRLSHDGYFLVCHTADCAYRRPLSLTAAKLKVRLQGMTCPDQHPLTVRSSKRGFFLGCENYPRCQYTERLTILDGV